MAAQDKQSLEDAVTCPEYRARLKEVYITEAQIKAKVAELAAAISKKHRSSFKEGEVVAVGVGKKLEGGGAAQSTTVALDSPALAHSSHLMPLRALLPPRSLPSQRGSLCSESCFVVGRHRPPPSPGCLHSRL